MDDREIDIDSERFEEQKAALLAREAGGPSPSVAIDVAAADPVVVSGHRGTRSFTLYQPIKVDGRMVTRISIRPPVGGDIDDWGSGVVSSSREMVCRLTGLHPAVIRGLDSIDLEILYKMFWDMVPDWLRDTAAADPA